MTNTQRSNLTNSVYKSKYRVYILVGIIITSFGFYAEDVYIYLFGMLLTAGVTYEIMLNQISDDIQRILGKINSDDHN